MHHYPSGFIKFANEGAIAFKNFHHFVKIPVHSPSRFIKFPNEAEIAFKGVFHFAKMPVHAPSGLKFTNQEPITVAEFDYLVDTVKMPVIRSLCFANPLSDVNSCKSQSQNKANLTDNEISFVMFANTFQSGFVSVFYSVGSNPLQLWDKQVKNGHIRRVVDDEVKSLVLEVSGTNVATTYITCPIKPRLSLGIKLPFLVMIIKNMKKYFTFEIQILDDKDMHRRFRVSNFQSTTKVRPFCTTMPIGLSSGWNQVQFNLADFTKRAYGSTYMETTRVQIHANVRIRRIYFCDMLYSDDQLPNEYKLFLPIPGGGPAGKAKRESSISKDKKAVITEELPPEMEEQPQSPMPTEIESPDGQQDIPPPSPMESEGASVVGTEITEAEPPSDRPEELTTAEGTTEPTTTSLVTEGEPVTEGEEAPTEPPAEAPAAEGETPVAEGEQPPAGEEPPSVAEPSAEGAPPAEGAPAAEGAVEAQSVKEGAVEAGAAEVAEGEAAAVEGASVAEGGAAAAAEGGSPKHSVAEGGSVAEGAGEAGAEGGAAASVADAASVQAAAAEEGSVQAAPAEAGAAEEAPAEAPAEEAPPQE